MKRKSFLSFFFFSLFSFFSLLSLRRPCNHFSFNFYYFPYLSIFQYKLYSLYYIQNFALLKQTTHILLFYNVLSYFFNK